MQTDPTDTTMPECALRTQIWHTVESGARSAKPRQYRLGDQTIGSMFSAGISRGVLVCVELYRVNLWPLTLLGPLVSTVHL